MIVLKIGFRWMFLEIERDVVTIFNPKVWKDVVAIFTSNGTVFLSYNYFFVISMPHYICVFIFEYAWNITYHSFDAWCLLDHSMWDFDGG